MATIGDKYKNILTGNVYEVKSLKGLSVLLESEDRRSQIFTEKENLKLFYEKVENENRPQNSTPLLLPYFQTPSKL